MQSPCPFLFLVFAVGCASAPVHEAGAPVVTSAVMSHESRLGAPADAPPAVEIVAVTPPPAEVADSGVRRRGRREGSKRLQ
jgi:hypothetical protein